MAHEVTIAFDTVDDAATDDSDVGDDEDAAEVIGVAGGQSETAGAVLWCDGRRMVELPPGSRVEVRRGELPVLLARLRGGVDGRDLAAPFTFTDRLVAKFGVSDCTVAERSYALMPVLVHPTIAWKNSVVNKFDLNFLQMTKTKKLKQELYKL